MIGIMIATLLKLVWYGIVIYGAYVVFFKQPKETKKEINQLKKQIKELKEAEK